MADKSEVTKSSKPYARPTLRRYGNIQAITAANAGAMSANDGGQKAPNTKTAD